MAFVNARGDYGNTALHLAVEHCNCATIAWLLDFNKSGKGRGRASLTLLNKDKLTPYTKAVRMAQEREGGRSGKGELGVIWSPLESGRDLGVI